MKNKRLFILLVVLILLNFSIIGIADEDTQFLIADMDDVSTGLNNFTSGYLTFDSEDDNIFVTSTDYDLSTPNSVRIQASNGASRTGIVNLTKDFSYIGFINISFESMWSTDSGNGFYWNFTDYNGNDVIRMRFTDDDWLWYQVGGAGWTSIDTVTPTTRQYLHITHNGTNQFNVKTLTSAFVVDQNHDFSGAYAGTYTNFSQMNFHIWSASGDTVYCYFDNFYISTTFDGQFCDVSDYESLCFNTHDVYNTVPDGNKYIEYESEYEYSMNLKSVILPISNDQYNLVSSNPMDYSLTVNGYVEGFADYIINFGDYYGVQWCDLGDDDGILIDNEKLLLCFASFQYFHTDVDNYYWYGIGGKFGGSGLLKYHNIGYYFANDQLDGYSSDNFKLGPCVYYESDLNDIILDDDILRPYIDVFGNEFIQFYKYDIKCQYQTNDYPKIIYNLSDDNITGGDYKNPYVWVIKKIDVENSTSRWWTQGFIVMYGSYQSAIITVPKKLTERGTYQIELWNSSDYGGTLDTLLYTSMPIYVCSSESGGGGDEGEGWEGGEWYGLPFYVPFIIGIFITLFITMSPLIIGAYITRNSRIGKINIPPLLYVGFFFMGMIVSVLFGFLPIWLPFVILFGMIVFFGVQWLYGKKGAVEGE